MTRTNAFGLLTILIRAAALWMAVSTLFGLAAGLASGVAAEWGHGPFLSVHGALLGSAGLLWLFADVVARLTLARPTSPLFESDLAASEWQRLAFSCIGLWTAVGGVLEVGSLLLKRFVAQRMYADQPIDVDAALGTDLAVGVLRLIVGVALLFGARGVVALVARMRGREAASTDGVPPAE